MVETFFGRSTFDGYSTIRPLSETPVGCNKTNTCTGNGGYILGYNKIVGSVRISQLRSKALNCSLPKAVKTASDGYVWKCYSRTNSYGMLNDVSFNLDTEDQADFGEFRSGNPYRYNGTMDDGKEVTDESMMPHHERAYGRLSWYRSLRKRVLYPPGA
jgi:hypothetical protein